MANWLRRRAGVLGVLLIPTMLGAGVAATVTLVSAQSGGGGLVHACVANSNGNLRVISTTGSCRQNETPLSFYTKAGAEQAFLAATGKAADADKLDGLDSTAFLGSTAKAADADKLDGKDSTQFLGSTAKAADADQLDGLDSTAFQRRVSSTCVVGSSIRAINSDGTVVCEIDDNTTYTAGSGLTLTGTQFSVNTSTIQERVAGSCGAGNAIRTVAADGTVTCQESTTVVRGAVNPNGTPQFITHGATVTHPSTGRYVVTVPAGTFARFPILQVMPLGHVHISGATSSSTQFTVTFVDHSGNPVDTVWSFIWAD